MDKTPYTEAARKRLPLHQGGLPLRSIAKNFWHAGTAGGILTQKNQERWFIAPDTEFPWVPP